MHLGRASINPIHIAGIEILGRVEILLMIFRRNLDFERCVGIAEFHFMREFICHRKFFREAKRGPSRTPFLGLIYADIVAKTRPPYRRIAFIWSGKFARIGRPHFQQYESRAVGVT